MVSAPTGCGKTTLLDLAVVHALQAGRYDAAARRFPDGRRRVTVYMAPTKARLAGR